MGVVVRFNMAAAVSYTESPDAQLGEDLDPNLYLTVTNYEPISGEGHDT